MTLLTRKSLALGAFLCGFGVILGAFAAHGLKQTLSLEFLNIFRTGVDYQLFHASALMLLAMFNHLWPSQWFKRAYYSFLVGILVFSGSLYILALSGVRFWGAITPLGGLAFIVGWGFVVVGIIKAPVVEESAPVDSPAEETTST